MSLKRVIEVAMAEVGTTEYPKNSNNVKYNTEYYGHEVSGSLFPYCVVFLWWVFKHANESLAFFGGAKTASCGTLLYWYDQNGMTVDKSDIKPGDIVILNFSGTKETQHCGLVTDVLSPTVFKTIEGNTTPGEEGSQDNGGSVAVKTRYSYQVVGVCRPDYKPEEIVHDIDYAGHWAEKDIDRAIELGFVKGYEDGTIRPEKSITRAEVITLIMRLYDKLMVK